MHGEWYSMPQATVDAVNAARAAGRRVIAVGTTSLRALEAAAAEGELRAGAAETRLFILPGYRFRVGRPSDHQFSPAAFDAADAGLGVRRHG